MVELDNSLYCLFNQTVKLHNIDGHFNNLMIMLMFLNVCVVCILIHACLHVCGHNWGGLRMTSYDFSIILYLLYQDWVLLRTRSSPLRLTSQLVLRIPCLCFPSSLEWQKGKTSWFYMGSSPWKYFRKKETVIWTFEQRVYNWIMYGRFLVKPNDVWSKEIHTKTHLWILPHQSLPPSLLFQGVKRIPYSSCHT